MSEPLLYEINTRCWLHALSGAQGGSVTLAEVPESEFLLWKRLGFTHLWLMGVWSTGTRSRAEALGISNLRQAYIESLPDYTDKDVAGSPYAVAAYRVPEALGGNEGLTKFRQRLNTFGLKLILDFVPNHLGLDHPWARERPELFVNVSRAEPETLAVDTALGKRHLAFGKDPNWPAWSDTLQIDYRRAEARSAMAGLLLELAQLCDGVRCDMAMLLLNDVFQKTWQRFPVPESPPGTEFWADAISATRRAHPGFLFLAEVYWGLEARLEELGFDYTYDKTLYDKLISLEPGAVQRYLLGLGAARIRAGAHFLENHDERRIASILPLPEHRAAVMVVLGLPGMRFLHEGQLQGMRKRLPVQLVRRSDEPVDVQVQTMYEQLLLALPKSAVGQGTFGLLTPSRAWADNPTEQHFILVQWTLAHPNFDLVAVNLAPHASQCFAPVTVLSEAHLSYAVSDLLSSQRFVRKADDLRNRGLYLDLPAHGAQILHFEADR